MRITPVNLNTHSCSQNICVQKTKNNNKQNVTTNYQTKQNSAPSFGSSMIEDMYYYFIRTLNNRREEQRKAQIRMIDQKIQDDTAILAKRLGIPQKEAAEKYNEYIMIGGLRPRGSGHELGLNKIMGYSQEKLDLIKDGITPVVMQVKAHKKGEELPPDIIVPNGILLYGPTGTGKSYMADALLEHFSKKDKLIETKVINVPWQFGDTDENVDLICYPFEEAKKHHKENGTHTIILLNNIDEMFSTPNMELLQGEFEYQTRDAAKNGVTWISTTNNVQAFPRWMFNPLRYGIDIHIDRVASDIEKSATLSYFIAAQDRKDLTNHDLILDRLKKQGINFYPPEIKKIMDIVDKKLSKLDHGNYERGYYRAPVKNEDIFEAINTLQNKEKYKFYTPENNTINIDKIDNSKDEIYIARKRGYYDKD